MNIAKNLRRPPELIKHFNRQRHDTVRSERRRVVVTGIGVVSCLGVGYEHVWNNLIAGICGLSSLQDEG